MSGPTVGGYSWTASPYQRRQRLANFALFSIAYLHNGASFLASGDPADHEPFPLDEGIDFFRVPGRPQYPEQKRHRQEQRDSHAEMLAATRTAKNETALRYTMHRGWKLLAAELRRSFMCTQIGECDGRAGDDSGLYGIGKLPTKDCVADEVDDDGK